jgi:hypothetical protein
MKPSSLLIAAALIVPSVSHALVRELANCSSRDGQYAVHITDNQGIGLKRTSHITAAISDANGTVVGPIEARLHLGMKSASFGRTTYEDTETAGQLFTLKGPSTNFRRYDLNAAVNGQVLALNDLVCTVFNGVVLQH